LVVSRVKVGHAKEEEEEEEEEWLAQHSRISISKVLILTLKHL